MLKWIEITMGCIMVDFDKRMVVVLADFVMIVVRRNALILEC